MSVNECAVTSQELKKDYTEQIQGESRCKASPLILTILEKFLRVNFRLRLNPTCFKILTPYLFSFRLLSYLGAFTCRFILILDATL
jgi:hypothetical protein